MNVDVQAIAGKAAHTSVPDKFSEREASARTRALSYLKAKFPDTDEQAFFTDYTGQTFDDVISFWAVAQAAEIDEVCASCKDGACALSDALKARNSRPVISVATSPRGFKFLDVRWTCGFACKFQPLSGEFGRMFRKSGIKTSCLNMTFKNYKCTKATPETAHAKSEAMTALKEQTCLILAGKPGTGKTHLAVAIALRAMEQGRQAIFRLVSAMLDEIQAAITDKGDYDGLMRQFKTVPCLVLDDLGHENMTAARASYLHQIIDYRYGEGLQTIITTNAKDIAELCAWDKEEYIMPIVSRIMGRGAWVTITKAEDFRRRPDNVK
ncbi:MAG: ATP-binding protein [Synergistaceae bacterium]|nr:ATP-binding protein [Synergistaceae bacterium]